MELKDWVEQNKILTAVLFWGGLFSLIWFLAGLRDNSPDLSVPTDDFPLEQYCGPGGTSC